VIATSAVLFVVYALGQWKFTFWFVVQWLRS